MMKTLARLLLCPLLVMALSLPVRAQALPAPPAAGQSEEVQPKIFIWGFLMNIAFKFAMSAFTEWFRAKASNDVSDPVNYQKLLFNTAGASVVSLLEPEGVVASMLGIKSVGAQENTVQDLPTKPIQLQNGQPNYQGVHVALVGFDRTGVITGLQPVTAGFRTGDRIKLKVLPTFDGLLVIENINPQGVRRQIYPPPNQAVSIKAGAEILVPLGSNQFFEFAGVTGEEQLVVTVRDPRAFGGAESKFEVSRKDERDGSSFVQETRAGSYPVIAQSIKLRHER